MTSMHELLVGLLPDHVPGEPGPGPLDQQLSERRSGSQMHLRIVLDEQTSTTSQVQPVKL